MKKAGRNLYEITLSDNTKLHFWFIGQQLEKLLKSYDIPFKKIRG